MDISGLTNTSASQSFPGYGGTASLPAVTQAKIMVQSQSLSLLPTASSANLGNLSNIYDAVGKQALGALSGLSAIEITKLSMGIGDGQTTAAPSAASTSATPAMAGSADQTSANTPAFKNPAIGATLDQLLKDDGYVAPDANPYVLNKDFFSDQGSLGGLLDSRV
ncbi:MAG: hypothetical protein JF616_08935 [Fibrobacteres bacterium]|jgi:hypothetical protein|nr:hypothetical protein [Fibrobacterota bacterium]